MSLTEKEDPAVEVITSASRLPDEVFKDYYEVLKEMKVTQIGHIHHWNRKEVLEDDLSERVNKADIIFFSGGDQLRLTSTYGGTQLLKQIKEQYIYRKVVIGGTSAGAMAMSTAMIYAGRKEVQQLVGTIKVTTGLEFMKDTCIDTHFIHRGRFVRLAQVIATNPTCIGIGIEEDTAIVVKRGFEAEVIGSGTIIIIEGYDISETNVEEFGSNKPVTIRDLKVHILSKDDKYHITSLNPAHL